MTTAPSPVRVYRLDTFVVPVQSRDEFMSKVKAINALLKDQPGFFQDFLFERSSGHESTQVVTLVEWESAEAMGWARAAVTQLHHASGFKPAEMLGRLGITANFETYTSAGT
jgi:heme-degrading monooxygenase HmoA